MDPVKTNSAVAEKRHKNQIISSFLVTNLQKTVFIWTYDTMVSCLAQVLYGIKTSKND